MRLIDADDLIAKLEDKYDMDKVSLAVAIIATDIIHIIIDAPTIEMEVEQCRPKG